MQKENIRTIAILGAGESGTGAALLAKAKGIGAFVSDKGEIKEKYRAELDAAGIPYEQGQHSEERILSADLIIKSPGIPDHAPLVKQAIEKNIPVISEIEWAGYFIKGKVIGITGTNGKTTTTTLTHWIFQNAGYSAALTGNIGHSLARQVAEEEKDYYVVELSSFQLDGLKDFKCHIAMLLNITPDHLDRYSSFEAYAQSKMRITLNQGPEDFFIYNEDDPLVLEQIQKTRPASRLVPFSQEKVLPYGVYIQDNQLFIHLNTEKEEIMSMEDASLKGKHNRANSMAAGVASRILQVRKDVIRESLKSFQHVEHRLEHVANVGNVEYINDSKATNVNSTWYALESMSGPVVWIAGGTDKGNDYAQLKPLVREKVKTLVAIGRDNEKLLDAFKKDIPTLLEAETMEDAVKLAAENAQPGYTVLLSPACASFDRFNNYEDRGRQFKQAVKSL